MNTHSLTLVKQEWPSNALFNEIILGFLLNSGSLKCVDKS